MSHDVETRVIHLSSKHRDVGAGGKALAGES